MEPVTGSSGPTVAWGLVAGTPFSPGAPHHARCLFSAAEPHSRQGFPEMPRGAPCPAGTPAHTPAG